MTLEKDSSCPLWEMIRSFLCTSKTSARSTSGVQLKKGEQLGRTKQTQSNMIRDLQADRIQIGSDRSSLRHQNRRRLQNYFTTTTSHYSSDCRTPGRSYLLCPVMLLKPQVTLSCFCFLPQLPASPPDARDSTISYWSFFVLHVLRGSRFLRLDS
jgi:hypothetical protein